MHAHSSPGSGGWVTSKARGSRGRRGRRSLFDLPNSTKSDFPRHARRQVNFASFVALSLSSSHIQMILNRFGSNDILPFVGRNCYFVPTVSIVCTLLRTGKSSVRRFVMLDTRPSFFSHLWWVPKRTMAWQRSQSWVTSRAEFGLSVIAFLCYHSPVGFLQKS